MSGIQAAIMYGARDGLTPVPPPGGLIGDSLPNELRYKIKDAAGIPGEDFPLRLLTKGLNNSP